MKKTLKSLTSLSYSTIISLLSGIIRTKLLAVYLGVNGLGIFSQLTTFFNLLNFIIPLGIPLGLTKFISEKEKEDLIFIKTVYENILKLFLITSIVSGSVICIFSKYISQILLNTQDYYLFVILLGIILPVNVIGFFFDAYLKGLKQIKLFVRITVISSLVTLVFYFPLVYYFDIAGAILSLFVNSFIVLYLSYSNLKKSGLTGKISLTLPKFNNLGGIFQIGIGSLITGSVLQLMYLILRTITINELGIHENGIYQSIFNISQNYFGFIFISMSAYTLPKYSELKNDKDLIQEINVNLRIVLFAIVPLIGLFYLFQDAILTLAFSRDFLNAARLLKYQFLGDFFKTTSWILGLWLIARGKILIWVLLDVLYSINFIVIYYSLLEYYTKDLVAISMAYLICNLIHLILNIIVINKYLSFTFTKNNLIMILLSFLTIVMVIFTTDINLNLSYFLTPLFLIIWLFITTDKNERKGVYHLLKNKN
ncbi:MAG: oligosaccharide flippase family protein [Ignavibacteria bacterium]|nr:oligosaccharide flippase family protein [Ignavibacteria bacterium]